MRNAALKASAVGLQAEVVGEDALPHQTGQPRQQDARTRRGPLSVRFAQSTSSSITSPSVPLDFFIRYVLMNTSMSPSRTRLMSPTCSLVR